MVVVIEDDIVNVIRVQYGSPKMMASIGSAGSPRGYSTSLTFGITQMRSTSVLALPIGLDMTPRPQAAHLDAADEKFFGKGVIT
jgi:hypothetical protein